MDANFAFRTCCIVVTDDSCCNQKMALRIRPNHRNSLCERQRPLDDDHFVACLQWYSCLHGPQSHFVTVTVLSQESDSEVDQSSHINLYATSAFVRHYLLESASSRHGFRVKRIADPVPLVSATISVYGEDAYRHLCRATDLDKWTMRLLLRIASRGEQPAVLFRRDDDISILDDDSCFRVLECEPVDQGVLVPSTSLTIVQATLKGICQERGTSESLSHDVSLTPKEPNIPFYMSLLSLTTVILACGCRSSPPKESNLCRSRRIVRLLALAFSILQGWKLRFRVRILARNPVRSGSGLYDTLDPFRAVFVSSSVLHRHALLDGSWSMVSLSNSGVQDNGCRQNKCTTTKLAMLCSIECHANDLNLAEFDQPLDDGVCYVTPLLWFNLNEHPSTLVQQDVTLVVGV